MAPVTVSINDAVAMTGLSAATLYRMMEREELESLKVGRRRLIRVASINKLLGVA